MTRRKVRTCCEAMDVTLSADQVKGIRQQTMTTLKAPYRMREAFVYYFNKPLIYKGRAGAYVEFNFCPFCRRNLVTLGRKMRAGEGRKRGGRKAK